MPNLLSLRTDSASPARDRLTRTAMAMAKARAAYMLRGYEPKLIEDPFAYDLIPAGARTQINSLLGLTLSRLQGSDKILDTDMALTVIRSRFVDDRVDAAASWNARQYVLIDPGLDTFCFRKARPGFPLQVYEAGSSPALREKRERLVNLGLRAPRWLTFLSLDDSREQLVDRLVANGFRREEPAIFSWMGEVAFRPRQQVLDRFSQIAAAAAQGSEFIFDYMDADAFDEASDDAGGRMLLAAAKRRGEPYITGFTTEDLHAKLRERGFEVTRHLAPADVQTEYLGKRKDIRTAPAHIHYVVAEKQSQVQTLSDW